MEIDIIRRETTGAGAAVYHENDTVAKYEIMDGAPVRGTRGNETTPHTHTHAQVPNISGVHVNDH